MLVDVDAPADDHELSVFPLTFEIGNTGLRFQGGLMVNLRGKLGLYHGGRFRYRLFSITLYLGLREVKVRPFCVYLDRILSHCLLRGF